MIRDGVHLPLRLFCLHILLSHVSEHVLGVECPQVSRLSNCIAQMPSKPLCDQYLCARLIMMLFLPWLLLSTSVGEHVMLTAAELDS